MISTTPGWVYVLASTTRPGVVKVGKTTRNAAGRAKELGRSEGYAEFGPFAEVWSRAVSDCARVESAAHRMLAHRRVKVRRTLCRELFQVEADEACRVVEAAANSLRGRSVPVRRRAFRPAWRPRLSRRARRMVGGTLALLALLWLLDGLALPLLGARLLYALGRASLP